MNEEQRLPEEQMNQSNQAESDERAKFDPNAPVLSTDESAPEHEWRHKKSYEQIARDLAAGLPKSDQDNRNLADDPTALQDRQAKQVMFQSSLNKLRAKFANDADKMAIIDSAQVYDAASLNQLMIDLGLRKPNPPTS